MRKFLALVTLFAGLYSPLSNATVWELALCESMLTSNLKRFATDHSSLLVSLRDLKSKMDKRAAGADFEGTGYEHVTDSNLIDHIKPIAAAKASLRIQEIEKTLTGGNLDQQIWAMEFRGKANAVMAMNELTIKYTALSKDFYALQNKLKEKFPDIEEKRRDFLVRHYSSLALINILGFATLHHYDGPVALASAALVFLSDTVALALRRAGRNNFDDKKFRINLALSMLHTLGESPTRDWVHIQSTNLSVPVEFHKSIYNNDGDRDEAQMKAYLMNSTISNLIAYAADMVRQMKDFVSNAGDIKRNVYLDQFAFWDQETKEPVWIFIYRASRDRPTPRKPKQVDTKESREESLQDEWLPEPTHTRISNQ